MKRPEPERRQYEATCDRCSFVIRTPMFDASEALTFETLDKMADTHARLCKGHRVHAYTHVTYQLVRTVYYPKVETDKE